MEPQLTSFLETGLPGIDDDHARLLTTLETMAELDDKRFHGAFTDLVGVMERDFRREESLMESIEYPAEPQHREQHARVLSGLHPAEAALLHGDLAPARRCIELLPKWLELHIATQDAPLAVAAELSALPGAHTP